MATRFLINGLEFCEVHEDRTVVHADHPGTFTLVTSRQVMAWPGDVLEVVGPEMKYRVHVLHSRETAGGWNTLCRLAA